METTARPRTYTTRLGSKVIIDYANTEYLYGRWFDGRSEWYPMRWHTTGRVWPSYQNHTSALDLIV